MCEAFGGQGFYVEDPADLRPTLDKLVRKFSILSRDVLGDAANEVLDTVMELDRIGNIGALTRLLQVAVPARQGQGERRMVVA